MKTDFSGLLKPLVNVTVTALTLFSLVGCYEDKNPSNVILTYDVESIVQDNNLTPEEKAEKLALIGEQLSTPSGFMYADEVLSLALTYNSSNIRALTYKKLGAPVMALKGVIKRLQPLVPQFSRKVQEAYNQERKLMSLNPSVDAFFNAGSPDIRNESQAQALVDRVMLTQNDLRLFFKGNKSASLTLYTPSPVGERYQIWASCPVEGQNRTASYYKTYTVKGCPYIHQVKYEVDAADIEALQHIAAGMQIATIWAGGYDATGGAAFEKTMATTSMNAQQTVTYARGFRDLGKLRNAAGIKAIKSMGSDFYAGASWAKQFQNTLCPRGPKGKDQRKGKLFTDGLCVQDQPGQRPGTTDSIFRVVAASLAGQSVAVFTKGGNFDITELSNNDGADYQTRANFFAPIVNPAADLKEILPTKFDKCGQAINVGDDTVAGLFPSRDGDQVAKSLKLIKEECK